MISESGKVIHTGMGPTSLAFGPNNFDQVKQISEIFNKVKRNFSEISNERRE